MVVALDALTHKRNTEWLAIAGLHLVTALLVGYLAALPLTYCVYASANALHFAAKTCYALALPAGWKHQALQHRWQH